MPTKPSFAFSFSSNNLFDFSDFRVFVSLWWVDFVLSGSAYFISLANCFSTVQNLHCLGWPAAAVVFFSSSRNYFLLRDNYSCFYCPLSTFFASLDSAWSRAAIFVVRFPRSFRLPLLSVDFLLQGVRSGETHSLPSFLPSAWRDHYVTTLVPRTAVFRL